jgi:hypothetical protein
MYVAITKNLTIPGRVQAAGCMSILRCPQEAAEDRPSV